MNTAQQSYPTLPSLFQLPLKIAPGRLQYSAIRRALNALFKEPLEQGELDFLQHKTINIHIEDAGLRFCVYLTNGQLNASQPLPAADLVISGQVYAFLMLGTRKEDADTLFFRRLLKSEGDTELGLFVKNFLDGLEPQSTQAFRVLDACMNNALKVADAVPAFTDRLPGRLQEIIKRKATRSHKASSIL